VDVSSLILGASAVLGGAALERVLAYRSLVKRLPDAERERWDALPLATRRGIRETVRKRRPIDDPHLARIAAEIAATTGPRRGNTVVLLLASAFFAVLAIVVAAGSLPISALFAIAALALAWGALYATPRRRRALVRAEADYRARAAQGDGAPA
jgi:Flp pilus assembly protein TadB